MNPPEGSVIDSMRNPARTATLAAQISRSPNEARALPNGHGQDEQNDRQTENLQTRADHNQQEKWNEEEAQACIHTPQQQPDTDRRNKVREHGP